MRDCISELEAEERIQTACYVFFHNAFPEYRGLLCCNLNNSKNKIDGARNKAMGIQKGRSDLVLYWQAKAYHIEMKTPTGEQSPEQIAWQKKVESQGFSYYIVRSLPEFQELIENIICTVLK